MEGFSWNVLIQYGMAGIIFGGFMYFAIQGQKQQNKILIHAKEERENWQKIVAQISSELKDHTSNAREFHNQVSEAHKYQRDEHNKIMSSCASACTSLVEIITMLQSKGRKAAKKKDKKRR